MSNLYLLEQNRKNMERINNLESDLQQARAIAARLRALLKICAKNHYCPVCRGIYQVHAADCELAKELTNA